MAGSCGLILWGLFQWHLLTRRHCVACILLLPVHDERLNISLPCHAVTLLNRDICLIVIPSSGRLVLLPRGGSILSLGLLDIIRCCRPFCQFNLRNSSLLLHLGDLSIVATVSALGRLSLGWNRFRRRAVLFGRLGMVASFGVHFGHQRVIFGRQPVLAVGRVKVDVVRVGDADGSMQFGRHVEVFLAVVVSQASLVGVGREFRGGVAG